jgi:xylulokinase
MILPYGNGAERTLENKNIGSLICGLNFNTHTKAHLLRAAQEGIVFSLNYGVEIMRQMGVNPVRNPVSNGVKVKTVRAGYANMFLSPLFAKVFATVTGYVVELYNTDGSQGAARGAGIGAGIYKNHKEAYVGLDKKYTVEPDRKLAAAYDRIYENWKNILKCELKKD